MELQLSDMADGGKDTNVIVVPDDNDGDDWPDAGLQNPAEAQAYPDKVIEVFDTFGDLINQDYKDALAKTIQNLKKLMAKHWDLMGLADPEVVIRSIIDPGCLHL